MRCTGTNKDGSACKANALRGTERCGRHPLDGSDATRPRDERWSREAFLEAFDETGMVSRACERVGISRQTAYAERRRDDGFAEAWAEVDERVVETMEREAYRRAVEGVETPLVSAGKLVTTVQSYSDGLLQFLLKARRPEKYRERYDVNHSGRVDLAGITPERLRGMSDEELADLERRLAS